jgi:DNA (cytosine-5)-methyltransferase 1
MAKRYASERNLESRTQSYPAFLDDVLRPADNMDLRVVDLFAGCGGLALGFEAQGFETHGYEMDPDACSTYRRNLTGPCTTAVLTPETALPQADVVIGGPPCQPFSVGGRQLGLADSRDGFPVFIAAIRSLEPKVWMFENVRGMFYRSRDYLEEILDRLRGLNYVVEHRVLNAVDFGVPQNRERLIVVGHRSRFAFPSPLAKRVTAGEAVGELAVQVPADSKFLSASMDAYVERYERASKCVNPRDLHLDRPARTLTCRRKRCSSDTRSARMICPRTTYCGRERRRSGVRRRDARADMPTRTSSRVPSGAIQRFRSVASPSAVAVAGAWRRKWRGDATSPSAAPTVVKRSARATPRRRDPRADPPHAGSAFGNQAPVQRRTQRASTHAAVGGGPSRSGQANITSRSHSRTAHSARKASHATRDHACTQSGPLLVQQRGGPPKTQSSSERQRMTSSPSPSSSTTRTSSSSWSSATTTTSSSTTGSVGVTGSPVEGSAAPQATRSTSQGTTALGMTTGYQSRPSPKPRARRADRTTADAPGGEPPRRSVFPSRLGDGASRSLIDAGAPRGATTTTMAIAT